MEIARSVLSNSVDKLSEDQKVGLLAYGHRKEGDCEDVEFLVNFENGSKSQVIASLAEIKPLGKTPLAFSAKQVIEKLKLSNKKATIILITDGIESCGGDICEVVQAARHDGIEFKMHIIGFGLKAEETEQLLCAATAGDGRYYDAADANGLGEVLTEATQSTVDEPEGNFSVYAIKNGKPIDALVKAFKPGSDDYFNYTRTYGDTSLLYLPTGTFELEFVPLASSDVKPVKITVQSFEDKTGHQTVSFDGGVIKVITNNNGEGWDAVVKVFDGSTTSVAQGRTYGKFDEYELNPGTYSVEMTAMVMKGINITHRIENVEVEANQTNEIIHNFESGIAFIGAASSTGLVDAVVNVIEINSNKAVDASRTYTSESSNPKKFILNPGTYKITLTALGEHKGKKESFNLTVKEGETVEKITTF